MRALESDFFALPRPRLFAHRGGAGVFPENTLAAFEASARLGIPYAEFDLHATRDGVVVVAHDPDLSRTCGREQRIADLSYAQLAVADAGYGFTLDGLSFPFRGQGLRIPRLDEVFVACPAQRFIVEIKQTAPSLVPAMLEVIDRCAMARRVLIASEHQAPLDEVRKLRPAMPTSLSSLEIASFYAALSSGAGDYRPPADAIQIPPRYEGMELATPAALAAAHRAGIEMHVWTINEEREMRALLTMGVDGVLSDFPERLMRTAGASR
jgi:glycerophosphoryl diester phosphodiesterase